MSQFLKVKTVDEVLDILKALKPLGSEQIGLDSACGRVLALPLEAPEPIPHFKRATMDGYAVRARDTFGASETLPALLEIAGEVTMGSGTSVTLEPGTAIAIPTGGMLPAGADAVVMVEYTSPLDERTIEVIRPVAPGDHILSPGEDVARGERLFTAGRRLRAQDIGVLAALGLMELSVYRRPRVAVISTGDEIVPPSVPSLPPGKIRDVNSFGLAAQVRKAGAEVGCSHVVSDDLSALVMASEQALAKHDVLLLSGGSSVGVRDFTLQVLDHFPDAELLVHGIAIRPGKPTILARIGDKLFWGLPGQPVSAMMICQAFVLPSLDILEGQQGAQETVGNTVTAVLSRQLPSVHGRTDYVPVILSKASTSYQAVPVFGKSAMIGILARASGYIVIPEHVEGLDQGTELTVFLFPQ